jgi:hypothetical protein
VITAVILVAAAIVPSAFEEGRLTNSYGQIDLVYLCVCAVATLGWLGDERCERSPIVSRQTGPTPEFVGVLQR